MKNVKTITTAVTEKIYAHEVIDKLLRENKEFWDHVCEVIKYSQCESASFHNAFDEHMYEEKDYIIEQNPEYIKFYNNEYEEFSDNCDDLTEKDKELYNEIYDEYVDMCTECYCETFSETVYNKIIDLSKIDWQNQLYTYLCECFDVYKDKIDWYNVKENDNVIRYCYLRNLVNSFDKQTVINFNEKCEYKLAV